VREIQEGQLAPSLYVSRDCNEIAAPMTMEGIPVSAPMPEYAGSRLPALHACLKAARTRSRIGSMLRGTVFSLVAALALLCGLEVFGIFFNMAVPAASHAALSEQLAFSAAVFACALALAAILSFLLTPDMATLARAADRAFALQERLSTALEVDAGLQPHAVLDPVRAALLADAERHAAAIDRRQIVRLDPPRAIWAVPVLIAAAVLLQLVPRDAFGLAASREPIAGAKHDGTGLTGQQGAEAAANLRRIAERLGKDAEERSDPYLRAIARTLERLSSDAERPGIDRRVLASALDRLLAHARQAYGQAGNADRSATPRDVVQQLQVALDDITGNRQAKATVPREPNGSAGAGSVATAEPTQANRPVQSSERKTAGGRTPSEMATPERPQAGWDDLLKDLDDYDPVDPRIEKERAFAEQQRRARAAAQSAGAAKDAGLGEGDRAGEGTRPLSDGNPTASAELAPGAEMLLPDQAINGGRRIRIELPPDIARSGVAPPTAGGPGEWQRIQEQAVERSVLAPEDRKVVGRYFMRSPEGRGP
jgi:hypothetical protein